MTNSSLIETKVQGQSPFKDTELALTGTVPYASSLQHLLDVISSIIAEEYIATAKQNPAVFTEIASGASRPRNDTPSGGIRNDKL